MEAVITDALVSLGNDGALGCVIDAGSYIKIRLKGDRLELYYTSERFGWSGGAIKDVPGVGRGQIPSTFNYHLAREPLKKMGIAVEDVRKAVKSPGFSVSLRAGASRPHQPHPDDISKLNLPIPFPQTVGDEYTNDECVKIGGRMWSLSLQQGCCK